MASNNDLLNAFRSLSGAVSNGLHMTQAAAHRHPRRVAAAVVTLLAGFTMTAFGVAPLTATTNYQPSITQISEAVALPALAEQVAQLDGQSLSLYRSDVSRANDTVDTLLTRLGVNDVQAANFLRTDPVGRTLLMGRPGKMIKAVTSEGRLIELIARGPAQQPDQLDSHFTRLTVSRANADAPLSAHTEQSPLQSTAQLASGTINSSLFAAADDAHVPDAITNQMAEIFGSDIDFRHELRKGDAFSVLYEAFTADGEPITWSGSAGRVLAARFINQDKNHDAVWFQEAGHK
ncbi:MAG: M23 family peptidase, partial [Rubrivivax sp.]